MKRRSSNPFTGRFIEKQSLSKESKESSREAELFANVSPCDNSNSMQAIQLKIKLEKREERNKVWLKKRRLVKKQLEQVEALKIKSEAKYSNVSDIFESLCVLYKDITSDLGKEKKKTALLASELVSVKAELNQLQSQVDEYISRGRCEIGNLDGARDTTRLHDWLDRDKLEFTGVFEESECSERSSEISHISELFDY